MIECRRSYEPKGIYPTPAYYPQTPISIPVAQLDTPTLFLMFYYTSPLEQSQAAKILRTQSWRFHTGFKAWFQRFSEPKEISDDAETGDYLMWETEHWGVEKRENFRFEYRFLEED